MERRATMAERGRRFWREAVKAYERSGETQETFAAQRGLKVSTLRAWIYRLRRERREATAKIQMVPVTAVGAGAGASPERWIEIGVAGGSVLRLQEGTDPTYVAALVQALGRAGC
jgi:hypothetical protein